MRRFSFGSCVSSIVHHKNHMYVIFKYTIRGIIVYYYVVWRIIL